MRINLRRLIFAALLLSIGAATLRAADSQTVIVVVGAAGEPAFGTEFSQSADRWAEAAKRAGAHYIEIGRGPQGTAIGAVPATAPATAPAKIDKQILQQTLQAETSGKDPLWLVLIGHGTFDGHEAKFNLRDEDFSDQELAAWLKPMNRPIAVIDCSSASSPFLNRLSGPNRVVITATRSGSEVNYARFGIFMSQAIANPAADLDKDGQTSLLEAFLAASHATDDFYKNEGRLATEHALLDDNGDGLGVSADWFQGTRATHSARSGAPVDGARANQWALIRSPEEAAIPADLRARRDELELKLESLRAKKAAMSAQDYYGQLDPLLLSLAHIYQQAGQTQATIPAGAESESPK